MHTDVSGHGGGTVRLVSPGADLLGSAHSPLDIPRQFQRTARAGKQRAQGLPPSLAISVPLNIPDTG